MHEKKLIKFVDSLSVGDLDFVERLICIRQRNLIRDGFNPLDIKADLSNTGVSVYEK